MKDDPEEVEIREEMAKLPPADRKLAEAQRWCPVQAGNRLGSMGKPFKVPVNGRPVFLCCDSCKEKALKDPDRTLATVERLREKASKAAVRKGGKP
jgi:hypothetical protein